MGSRMTEMKFDSMEVLVEEANKHIVKSRTTDEIKRRAKENMAYNKTSSAIFNE